MFESAEIGHKIDKATYDAEVPGLRERLLDAQYDLLEKPSFPVIILIGGVDGAGKGETVNLLNEWMDPRHVHTHAMGTPSDEERERPRMWRYIRALPPKGKIGIFFGSWYTDPIVQRAYRAIKDADLEERLEEIVRFERMLAAEGALLLKFWFHLSRDRQKARLTELARDPKTSWRVTDTDWEHYRLSRRFQRISEKSLRRTSIAEAPWVIVEGTDARYRSLTVGRAIHDAMRRRLDAPAATAAATSPPLPAPSLDRQDLLSTLDPAQSLEKEAYEDKLLKYQRKLNLLTRKKAFASRSLVVVFEGMDAAGKGGAIRRITGALDARQYQVIPVAAPTEEERAQPYLWRFWRRLPGSGKLTIFDRSWYGRVLVERVEGFCSEADYLRAYGEINDFEEQVAESGAVVAKFWLQLSPEKQLERFQERERTGFKRFKITPEDYRNREKWGAYQQAASDMIDRTSTAPAPWTLVAANDKYHARIHVLRTLCERLEAELGE
jgi:polyphosphate:AMP phosphotransferase